MTKADELFKKIGYEKTIYKNSIDYINDEGDRIIFMDDKKFYCEDFYSNSLLISVFELQAINEKIKELGWE